jgi:hypothetical protein
MHSLRDNGIKYFLANPRGILVAASRPWIPHSGMPMMLHSAAESASKPSRSLAYETSIITAAERTPLK